MKPFLKNASIKFSHSKLLRFSDWPVAVKLLVSFVPIALLPIAGIFYYSHTTTRQSILQLENNRLVTEARILADEVDKMLKERLNLIRAVASAPLTKEFAQAQTSEVSKTSEVYTRLLETFQTLVASNTSTPSTSWRPTGMSPSAPQPTSA